MKNLAFIFIAFTAPAVCYSEPFIYKDGSYKFKASNSEECYGLGTSNPLLSVCQKHFKNISEDKLESTYNNLLSKLTRDKKELIKAQEKWKEFSNLQCQFEAKASKAYSKPYNAYTEIFNTCIDRLRAERTSNLKKIETGCPGCVQ
jgi:uncharacterized protein YecT (DUF1311 family)